jgi:hypothetical protein
MQTIVSRHTRRSWRPTDQLTRALAKLAFKRFSDSWIGKAPANKIATVFSAPMTALGFNTMPSVKLVHGDKHTTEAVGRHSNFHDVREGRMSDFKVKRRWVFTVAQVSTSRSKGVTQCPAN